MRSLKLTLLRFSVIVLITTTIESVLYSQSIAASGYAEVNGTKLYYETAGTGEPLVLIHGSFGDRRHWDLQFKEFSKKYKVIRYDVRGYGKSALPSAEQAYTDADDLDALLTFLGIKKAHLCGLSMGSIIAIDYALAFPEKYNSLILIGPRVAGDGSAEYRNASADSVSACLAKVVAIIKNGSVKEGTDSLWAGNNPMSKSVVSTSTRRALLQMGYEYSWFRYLTTNKRGQLFPMAIQQLNKISKPTLIVTAEFDLGLCKNVADIMAKNIAGSQLISIKEAGHIMNMDNPKEFNKVVYKFIGQLK